jgi:hypothetical protein
MRYRSPTTAGATSLYFALFLSDAFFLFFFVFCIRMHHQAAPHSILEILFNFLFDDV